MKDFFDSLKDGINHFIKSETNGPDAKANLIFGILLIILVIGMFVPDAIQVISSLFTKNIEKQSSVERILVILFMFFYFPWCVKKLGKINDEKKKIGKRKRQSHKK